MELLIKPLSPHIGKDIPLPYYATEGAAALDLHACLDEAEVIPAGGRALIPTGLAVAIPAGYVGIVAVRSSMGIKNGVTLSNGIGVIDSDYRGPLGVGLLNTTGGHHHRTRDGRRCRRGGRRGEKRTARRPGGPAHGGPCAVSRPAGDGRAAGDPAGPGRRGLHRQMRRRTVL